MSDWFFALDGPPAPEALAAQAAWEVEEAARQQLITACANRDGGHAWELEGEPGETPCLSCAGCPATSHDLLDSCLDFLYDQRIALGGHLVHFGQALPTDAEGYRIPVNVTLEDIVHPGGPWGGPECDVAVHITDRPAVNSEASS